MLKSNVLKIFLWIFFIGITNSSFGQGLTISGHITDENDNPMPAVTVAVVGTTTGTISDESGFYTIKVASAESVLTYSFIGYLNENVTVGNRTSIDVKMVPDVKSLEEVVVVGYGTSKKSDLTTSMVSLKSDDIKAETQGNFTAALQGKAAGVQVINNSGAPGAAPAVLIRGFTSINLSVSPLYVVDGIPVVNTSGNGDINFLSPDEIESIEVLKDASASAIFGTRASAGVIMVTTKRGKAGKTQFSFNYSYGIQATKKPYDAMNSEQYAEAMNTSYANSSLADLITDTDNLNYTDWWSAGVRNTSPIINASFNANGGNEKHKFNVSATYFKQQSLYQTGDWERFTARINNDIKFADWITVGIDLNPRREKWNNTPDYYGDYLQIDPITPIMRPADQLTGDENEYSKYMRSIYTYVWNPVARDSRQKGNNGDNYALYSNSYVDIHPFKNFVFRSQAGVNIIGTTYNTFNPIFTIDASHEFNSITNLSRKKVTDMNWTWQNTATYSISKGKHSGSIMAGMTAEEQNDDYVYAYAEGFPNTSSTMQQLDATNGTVKKVGGNTYRNSLTSYISRITYNYDNRYLLTATGRRDGSSKFLSANKWAFFPSASLAWRISQESFLKNNLIISDAKIFAGWGAIGNQNLPSDVYLSKLATDYAVFGDDATVTDATTLSTMKNKDIKWETVEEKNLGMDIKLFNSALSATIEVYQKLTHDMLFQMNYPYYSGFPSWGNIWTNIGKMEAKGLDISLNYSYSKNKLKIDLGTTFTKSKIKMKQLAGTTEILGGYTWNSANTTRIVVGDEPGYFYGYKTDGIFQNYFEINSHTSDDGTILQKYARPGDIRFVDVNGDGSINSSDRVKLGSPYADFTGGFNFNVSYNTDMGSFDLNSIFTYSYGNEAVNWLINDKYNATSQDNLASDALSKAWHGEGTSNKIPILSHNDLNENYTKFSDFYVEDASFLKLKSIQLGYSIPKRLCSLLKVSNLRFTLSGQNLHTWTKFSGIDPETSFSVGNYGFQRFGYPTQRTYILGINLTF